MKALFFLIAFFCFIGSTFAQPKDEKRTKIIVMEKSGKKPHFTNWSRGKDFKYLSRKSRNLGLEEGDKYLFVGEARVRAYWEEDGDEYGFTALEATEEGEDDARIALAFLLNSYVDAATEKNKSWDGLKKKSVQDRSQSISTKASFGGFTKVGSYYQKELDQDNKTWYHSWVLMSYTKDRLQSILEQYAEALKEPDLSRDVMAEIETAAENLDTVDDEEFNFQ